MDLDCMSLGASLCGNDLFPLDPPPSLIARYFVSGVPLAELGCEEIYFSRFSIKKVANGRGAGRRVSSGARVYWLQTMKSF